MRFHVVAVGRLKERHWREACEDYIVRLGPYGGASVQEVPDRDPGRCGGQSQAADEEAACVLRVLKGPDHVVLLDRQGVELSSEGIAQRIDALALSGISRLVFVIGGSFGAGEGLARRADESWSLGRITLPHNLARVVLLEQLYRACRISAGHPYHK